MSKKSRPIMFGVEMVRAILAGQKTQTRRVVKVQPPENTVGCVQVWKGENHWDFWGFNGAEIKRAKCPYGIVGDRLWVREGYADVLWDITASGKEVRKIIYKADEQHGATIIHPTWKAPLFMPRAASRIELEITGIRVERVQDINQANAIAEGCGGGGSTPRQTYCDLWSSIHSYESWLSNPWVWVVEFKRVEVRSTINHYEAIAWAENLEYGHQSEVTESQLLDSLKSLIKMNGHRDPISDELLPFDQQPELEVAAAMRLVVRAGGAV